MKHTLIFPLVLLSFLSSPAESQSLMRNYGFKVAITSSDQSFDYAYPFDNQTIRRVGFAVGGYVEWFDFQYFTLVTQAEYVQKGRGLRLAVTGEGGPTIIGYGDFYSRLDYLSVPILLKFLLPGQTLTPFLLVGPRADFLLGHSSDENIFGSLYDDFKKTSIGGTIGLGTEIKGLLPVGVVAEARYNLDLADSYSTQILKVRNNSFDFWLGIQL